MPPNPELRPGPPAFGAWAVDGMGPPAAASADDCVIFVTVSGLDSRDILPAILYRRKDATRATGAKPERALEAICKVLFVP